MDFKNHISVAAFLFSSLVIGLSISGCGKKDGYANSGSLNTYNFIYVGNFGSSTLNSFYIDKQGVVTIAANSITTGAGTSSVNDLQVSPDGKHLYSANKSTNNVSSYSISPLAETNSGQLTYLDVAAAGSGSSAVKFHPNGKFAYITNSSALTNNISFYTVDQTSGALTLSLTSYTARTNPTNLVFSPSGSHLFVINRGTSDISSYSVSSSSGALNTIALSTVTGSNPEDLAIHPNGSYLYTLCVGSNRIYMHKNTGGTVSALTPAFINTGNGPKKLVISPNGKYVYVSNNTDNTISVYSIDSSTGLLTQIAGSPFAAVSGAGVYALSVTPESRFLIASGDSNGNGYIYQIDDTTGAISQIGSALTLGANPRSIEIVPLSVIE